VSGSSESDGPARFLQRSFHFSPQSTQQLTLELQGTGICSHVRVGVALEAPHEQQHSARAFCLLQGDVRGEQVRQDWRGGAEEREEERHREFQWRLEAREGVKWEGCAVAQRRGGRR
jgi:hypothetical protein